LGKCRIVLIEDNAADVFLVKLAMRRNEIDCELIIFPNGEAAAEALLAEPASMGYEPAPNVILLDMNTPKSDGFEVLDKFRNAANLAHTAIAIITSSQARSDLNHIKSLAGIRYIQKHSQLNDFLDTVGRAIKEMLGESAQPRPQ